MRERPVRSRRTQDCLVVAFERVHREQGVTQREFCQKLGIPERTFHSWKTRPPAKKRRRAPPPSSTPVSPPAALQNRGRFDLSVIPPGVELTADTTALDLFDIPLKLIAAQDPGRRDQELYEAFHLDAAEDARRVVAVVDAATRHRSFTQIVTDQGTPYCAHEAKEAYEARALEHAPTKEAAPTQKATLERSFGTLKPLLAPLAALTSMVATAVPALRSPELAKTVGRYLISLVVDAYRIGAESRVAQTAAPFDRAAVEAAAEDWVHRRRDDHGSCRELLARLHEEYRMDGSREEFVRALRRHDLKDVEETERRLRTAACRCQARICDRYFVGILRNVVAEREESRQDQRQRARERARRRDENRRFTAEQEELRAQPELAIYRGLTLISLQWQPAKSELLMSGRGMGYVDLRRGLAGLRARDGAHAALDEAEVVWRQWTADKTSTTDACRCAIRSLWNRLLKELFEKPERDFTAVVASRIINPPPLTSNPRSPP